MAFTLLGPGIDVDTIGPVGSSGKKACSPLSGTAAAAAEAYCLRRVVEASLADGRAIERAKAGRTVRRRDAISLPEALRALFVRCIEKVYGVEWG